jgi:hypothetical protein
MLRCTTILTPNAISLIVNLPRTPLGCIGRVAIACGLKVAGPGWLLLLETGSGPSDSTQRREGFVAEVEGSPPLPEPG